MTTNCAIFVEGNDKLFVEKLLSHMRLSNFEVGIIGGGVSKLHKAQPTISRRHAEGKRISVILDADADANRTREKFEIEKKRLDLPVGHVFVVPDDKRPGCLETLLEEIAVAQHRGLYECFSRYEECVSGLSDEYRLPDRKARVYAFCLAVGNGPKESERDYGNADHWDLDAAALNPLKEFLRTCAWPPTDSDAPEDEK